MVVSAALTACAGPYQYYEGTGLHDATAAEVAGDWENLEGTRVALRKDGTALLEKLDQGNPSRNRGIQDALDAQMNGLPSLQATILERVAFMVVAASDGTHPWGGHRHREQHYSASLLKVAGFYCAYEPRRSGPPVRAASRRRVADSQR